jgi:hypothetical protein
MYFNSAGLWDGAKKFVVVALWVALSGAVAGLIAWVSNLPINQSEAVAVASVALVNALLAGAQKWLSTKK